VGDSPILGAGLYVDGEVGAAGSTGRGEANLFGLSSFLVVELMRQGRHPKDAAFEALRRIKAATVEKRLLNADGNPSFNVKFYAVNRKGEYAGVSLYAETRNSWESGKPGTTKATFALCTEAGPQTLPCESILGVQAES
jgi:N4-(beta-N-acetylglucosaminyl)-L-asparaginase